MKCFYCSNPYPSH